MLAETAVISIVIAKIRKHRLSNLETYHFRGWYLFICGFFLQALPLTFKFFNSQSILFFFDKYFSILFCFSFILIFIGLLFNIKKLPVKVIFAGVLLNFTVIVVNAGLMPVWKEGLIMAGFDISKVSEGRLDYMHNLMSESTRLAFLGDIIPIPKPYPLPKMLSIGDLFLALGVFLLIQQATKESQELG